MTVGIYKITNLINNKSYIGKSINIEMRFIAHRTKYNWDKEKNKPLYRAFKKYGIENFSFSIVKQCNKEDLDKEEIYWIGYYNTYQNGYNITIGGDGGKTFDSYREKFGKLTEDEVIYLRKRYAECKYPKSLIYEKEFSDRITKRGFSAIWSGQNSKDIMPEVFTEENRTKRIKLEREYEGALRRKIPLNEFLDCKQQIANGKPCKELWREKYQTIYSYGGFRDLMKTTPLDERIDFNEKLSSLWMSLT